MKTRCFLWLTILVLLAPAWPGTAQVLINEIMYHPVERPAFDTNGLPILDLSEDVHEFVELHNTNASLVNLAGWKLSGGISFDFPADAAIAPGGFVVVAKNPARLTAVTNYTLTTNQILGPWSGNLANSGDTLRLRDALDEVVDSVSYSSSFPWAIGANALGADDEWTGLNSSNFQYRGRSLERLSVSHPPNDPGNWIASPLATGPTPGRTNSFRLAVPRPIVTAFSAAQAGDGASIIRANQPVRLDVIFSATNQLSAVSVEYFLDNINVTNEARFTVALTNVGAPLDAHFAGGLPGQPDRSVVRFHFRANRGAGVETVSPRADDPFAWHAYFVTPVRASANPIYDVFIATASLNTLNANISQSPRRIVLPDPPGTPRASWDATEPAIFVHNGVVHDIRLRHHGSRYNRNASRRSYKFQFPDYAPLNGRTSVFETDKGEEHRLGSKLYDAVDLPVWRCRYVDLYQNTDGLLTRLEQEEMDRDLYRRWTEEQDVKFPGTPRPGIGEFYKSTGVIPFETGTGQGTAPTYEAAGEGPYYIGNCAPIPPKAGWSLPERYEATFGLQLHGWKGGDELRQMVTALWAARGDSPTSPSPNLAALRAFLAANFDVDATLTYIAIRNWSAPFDNATHNHFIWRKSDGRWGMLPWDLDVEFGTGRASQNIFWDEYAVPQPDTLRGPQWIKDSFLKAFREEYRQKVFILNNTLLTPASLTAIGAGGLAGYATARQSNVNTQLGLGTWSAPQPPVNLAPANNAAALPPAALQSSAYAHTEPLAPAHASTTWMIRSASGGYSNPVVRVTSATNLTALSIPFDKLTFGEAYFWKCFHTDTNGHPSTTSVETRFYYGTGPAAPGNLLLNEIMADNHGSAANGPTAPDFIELLNTSDLPKDLSQVSLSDNPLLPGKYVFPAGTVLAPHDFLVVWCDDATNAPGLHSGFALDNDGQTVALFTITNNNYQLADAVTFGPQIADKTIGRVGGAWGLNNPTPGATNLSAALGSATSLKLNEWLASATTGPDWFELFNPDALPVALGGLYVSDSAVSPTNSRLAALSFIATGGFRQFIADEDPGQGPRHVNFKLSASGESLILSATNLAVIDAISFGPQAADVSQGRLPDGTAGVASFPGSASPEAPNFLPIADIVFDLLVPDIFLRNIGPNTVDVGGWWLSDDPLNPKKYLIPGSVILAAGDRWMLDDDKLPFFLDQRRGGRVVLSRDNTNRVSQGFGPYDGVPYARVLTSLGAQFTRGYAFDATGNSPFVGPVVIGEVQYHPPDLPGDDDDYEFIELANLTAAPADLFLPGHPEIPWHLRDAVSFSLPTNTTLAAGERVLVLGFDPATNTVALSNFLAVYEVLPGTRLFGPYSGKLDNAGASVELAAPQLPIDIPGPDYGAVYEILLDRVKYADAAPWPPAADGTGASLQRQPLSGYGNEPLHWFASGVSPGGASASNVPPVVAFAAPASGAVIPFHQPIALTATATDPDGTVRRVEFFADGLLLGDDASAPFTFTWSNAPAGPHTLTARATDNRLGIVTSTPVLITVSNRPPTVALTAPTNGSFVTLPADILLEATAGDLDGAIITVEFFANGQNLGQATNAPYRLLWMSPNSGAYTLTARATDDAGAATVSAGISIVAAREISIAYLVDTNTVGTQSLLNPYAIGMDFNVLSSVMVTHFGCFDSGSDGISASSTLTTQIYNRNGPAPLVVGSASFSSADPGALVGGSRFKALSTPILLTNGSYSVVGYGYDGNNRNGNIGTGNAKTWITDDGGGLLAFTGGGRYGANAPGGFPTTLDGGPADRYAAGTFQFRRLTATPTIVSQPASILVRPGLNTNFSVSAIGDAPLRYQWSFNGAAIPNATNTSLTISNALAESEGAYRVVVTNALGSATSVNATLGLLLNPGFILRPLDQFVVSNGSFTVSVVITGGPPPFRYEWRELSARIGFTNSDSRTNFFTFGPVVNPAARQWRLVVTNAASVSPGITTTFNVTALADRDGDGLPDSWETLFGLNPDSAADRAGDTDGDGQLNWQEYLAGTVPTNSSSYLKIDSLTAKPGATLTFGAVSNKTYTVQFTDALGAGPWSKLDDVAAHPTNRVQVILDPAFTTNRFYRLVTPEQP